MTPAEEQPDNALVEEAYSKLAGIFFSHYQDALLEAGRYIIEKFYNDDIELARQKKPIKEQSYTQLVERLQQQREDSPKKSWLFNAVNLVIQEHDFSTVQALGQLNTTHKLLLLPVPDTRKQALAEETVEKGYTTRQLAEAIKKSKKQRKKTLYSCLAKPEELFSSNHNHLYSRNALAAIRPKRREVIKEKIKKQARKVRAGISEQHYYAEQYEALTIAVDAAGNTDDSVAKQGKGKISGTREWAEKSVNIATGCPNNCRYCYARYNAVVRFKRVDKGEWDKMIVRNDDVFKRHPKYNGTVLFPSTHDILPENIHACTIVLENLLKVGNRVLIVSKPRLECIEQLCKYFRNYKAQILFRFTIGATDNEILKFWEPGAPEYEERKSCIELAHKKKFKTSVSAEPMLDSANIDKLIEELLPFITDALWVGKMNKIKTRINIEDEQTEEEVKKIEDGQTDEIIKGIYQRHKDNPQIKWKDSIKKVVGIEIAKEPGLDK